MFDVIRKKELFGWVNAQTASGHLSHLKDVQDAFILSEIGDVRGKRILEVGGGDSRVLRRLAPNNECWNADRFEGQDGGPPQVITIPGVRNVLSFMGERSSELLSDYFDIVFSVSVIESVLPDKLDDMFQDCVRVLKPEGTMLHAVDLYMFDETKRDHDAYPWIEARIAHYRRLTALPGLKPAQPPADVTPVFRSDYATNPDYAMLAWNQVAPQLAPLRAVAQSASLKIKLSK